MKTITISSSGKVGKKKEEVRKEKNNSFLTFLTYLIPTLIVLGVLYLNYLPFGYSDEREIDVGSEGDTKGVFYLQENNNLGSRQTMDGETFRFVDGVVYAIYEPQVVLKNAKVKATLEGENVYFPTQPPLDFLWDYDWSGEDFIDFEFLAPASTYEQFLEGEEREELNFDEQPFSVFFEWTASLEEVLAEGDVSLIQNATNITLIFEGEEIIYELPDYFLEQEHTALLGFTENHIYFFIDEEFIEKRAFQDEDLVLDFEIFNGIFLKNEKVNERIELKDDCAYFDGHTRLILPDSGDLFEVGPFAIYVEWIPEEQVNSQQIIGHHNWEIFQSEKNLTFQIGRTEPDEVFHSVNYTIDEDFFEKKHNLLAIYNPNTQEDEEGYIKLFVDEIFTKRLLIQNNIIKTDYGEGEPLSLGWSKHNYSKHPHFKGSICNVKFSYIELEPLERNSKELEVDGEENISFPFIGEGNLKKITLEVKK